MKFIATIAVIALSGAAVCSQGDHVTRTANTDFDHPQSNSSSYLPTFSTPQPLEKSQIFQAATNSQQNDITDYRVQRLSLLYTPSKTGYSVKPNSQQYLSMCMQGFTGSTSYNSRLNQLSYASVLLPQDIPKLLSTHLSPQPPLFPSTTSRPLRSIFRTGKQKSGIAGRIDENIKKISIQEEPSKSVKPPTFSTLTSTSGVYGSPGFPGSSGASGASGALGGYSGSVHMPSGGGFSTYSIPGRPSPPFTPLTESGTGTGIGGTGATPRPLYLNTYLPPRSNTQKPPEKPQTFQVVTNSQWNNVTSYTTQRPASLYIPPNIGYPFGQPFSAPFSTPRPSQQLSSTYVPQGYRGSSSYNPRPSQPSYSNTGLSAFPPLNLIDYPKSSSLLQPPLFPSTSPRLLSSMIGVPGPSSPSRPSGPPPTRGYPSSGYPSSGGGFSSTPGYSILGRPFPPFTTPNISVEANTNVLTMGEGPKTTESGTGTGVVGIGETTQTDEDLNHPPHVHNLDMKCSDDKTMMTIKIEFNRVFDGVIYSKGYFMNPNCTYVKQNSGSTMYSFTVNLGSCGTQFINDFEGETGQAYLENVVVLQNEPGIQEVWDTVRRVRCLWKRNINKALMVNLSVDMLNQEIVTFSGDTATAKLDIQIGKGPFAPAANGLVKIGETMTLVVSVKGDPGFDLQVRDCLARDEASTNMLQLTDERGCILKPKLFGAFQKTKETGNTGASIIAYAFFQAFKFPDVMDLFIECNVELCKTNCESCPEANQIEPGRRRRSVTYAPPSNNSTNSVLLSDSVRVGRRFKVIMLDDLIAASSQILDSMETVEAMIKAEEVCMSNSGFYTIFSLMLSTLFIATINAAVLYIKLQQIRRPKFMDL